VVMTEEMRMERQKEDNIVTVEEATARNQATVVPRSTAPLLPTRRGWLMTKGLEPVSVSVITLATPNWPNWPKRCHRTGGRTAYWGDLISTRCHQTASPMIRQLLPEFMGVYRLVLTLILHARPATLWLRVKWRLMFGVAARGQGGSNVRHRSSG
jgi:hypothetical protein